MAILAKLSPPRLASVHPRERLFGRFDQFRRQPAVWISGPPGAGKTTLMASYLESRALPALWYQVDGGDADPASFFYYLAQCARQAGLGDGAELPLLTPEYLPDLAGFARRYFRDLFAGLPGNTVLVLDNYQELPETSPLQALIAGAVKEIPASMNVVFLCRTEPPKGFAGVAANGALAHLVAEELALTLDEAIQVVALDGGVDQVIVQALHARTQGWAAGMVLLAKRYRRLGAEGLRLDGHEAVADYFDSELLSGFNSATRELLLHTAWLPRFTAEMAAQLTGNPDAASLLAALHRQHCFTYLSQGPEPSYQYHALFRDFLLARAHTAGSDARRQRLQHRAAELLAANGQEDEAFHLYCQAGNPAAAVHLLLSRAPVLIGQGRWQMLQGWLAALPKEMVEAMPWLTYWQGVCIAHAGPSAARGPLQQAHEGFVKAGDTLGQGLAAAAIVETYVLDFSSFRSVDDWILALEAFLAAQPSFPCLELELRVLTSTGLALYNRQPRHPLLALCLVRIGELLRSETGPDDKVAAATFLLNYFNGSGELEEMQAIEAAVGPLVDHPEVRPLTRLWWWTFVALLRLRSGSLEETLADLNRAEIIAEEYGFRFVLAFLPFCKAHAYLVFGQPAKAEVLLRKVKPSARDVRGLNYHGYLECLLALSADSTELALERARRMVEVNREVGMAHWVELALSTHAVTLARLGEHEAAQRAIDEALPLRAETHFARHDRALLAAYLALLRGDRGEARSLLAEAFATGSARGYVVSMHWPLGMMPSLCAFALEEGIEPQHARLLIRTLNLQPPSPDAENWPWPLRIHTLGRFGVRLDDAPLATSRKAPKKLIALLKAIIALGGREVPEPQLADALWPDEEGDAARTLLATALHRLRKLLGDAEVIQLHEGRVTLDAQRVWVDAWAFERLAASPADPAWTRRALALYHGSFLVDEPELPWAVKLRERLRAKFMRLLTAEAQRLEQTGESLPAAALYARGIDADPLGEVFYQGLMHCYRQEQRTAEAIAVYRRLRQTLSVTLGVAPSPASEALYRELIDG